MPFYTTVRARLKDDPQQAMAAHNAVVEAVKPTTLAAGGTGHRVYGNVQDPADFMAMDTWETLEGMQQAYGDPEVQAKIFSLFDGPPEIKVWSPRDGWSSF